MGTLRVDGADLVTDEVLEIEDTLCDFDEPASLLLGDREIVPGEVTLDLEAIICPVGELELKVETVEKVIIFD